MKKPSARTVREWLNDLLFITLGSLCYAVSVLTFSSPNDIAPGGVTGLAILAKYLWGLPIGVMTIVLNVPLLLAGSRRLGRRFLVRTLIGLLLSSVLTDVLAPFIPVYRGEMLLVCLFGGALCGLGLGLILIRGSTTGGTEIAARLLEQRFPHIPIGRLMLLVDGVVIAVSALVYRQVESAMYAVVFAFVSSLVTDWVVYGGRRGKMALISTARQPEITAAIFEQIDRGVTLLDASGGYTGREQKLILCAVSRDEVAPLKRLVFDLDPQAFFMLVETDEVLGFGWQNPHPAP